MKPFHFLYQADPSSLIQPATEAAIKQGVLTAVFVLVAFFVVMAGAYRTVVCNNAWFRVRAVGCSAKGAGVFCRVAVLGFNTTPSFRPALE